MMVIKKKKKKGNGDINNKHINKEKEIKREMIKSRYTKITWAGLRRY
jgi:hypothetical protein